MQKIVEWFTGAVVGPFAEFFRRTGKLAVVILLLVSTYRITDITMAVMANPFYLDLGFNFKLQSLLPDNNINKPRFDNYNLLWFFARHGRGDLFTRKCLSLICSSDASAATTILSFILPIT